MNESHSTRSGGMKQDILDFENEFASSLESLKSSIDEKINFAYEHFDSITNNIEKNMVVIVADSLIEVKDAIIEALRAENMKHQQKVEKLENRIYYLESDVYKQAHYNRRGIIEIQGIPLYIEGN